MNMIELIVKKKQGLELNEQEINYIVNAITNNSIPDYQITAWTMAVCFQGMNDIELFNFTKAIINSGEMIDLSKINGFKVDKHSTGGVGDKTSLVFGPIVASLGLKVTKISGKGLGITGGTIDKLETITNFKCDLSIPTFTDIVNKVGMSIISQTSNLVPADKRLYTLRDVSGTVDSMPLIAASIMSKKIAMGADLILLDVKCGKGAFISNLKQAKILAKLMINIGKRFNKKVYVIISDMNKPLGKTIGNILELQETILALQNKGPKDLKQLVVTLTALALLAAGQVKDLRAGKKTALAAFTSSQPLEIFYNFIKEQNGDINFIKNINNIKSSEYILLVTANESGYLDFTNNFILGKLSVELGAGRLVKETSIDPSAGIVLKQVHGDFIKKNQVIMELHTNKPLSNHDQFIYQAKKSFIITNKKINLKPLILKIIM